MSDKPIAEKLQIKGPRTVCVLDAPASLRGAIAPNAATAPEKQADVLLVFTADRAALDKKLAGAIAKSQDKAIVWVAYPKQTSGVKSDLNRDQVREIVLAKGWDTVSQVAIDATWSALRIKRVA